MRRGEEERPSAPVAPEGGDVPDAEPLALEPASDRRLPGSLGWALLGSQVTEAVLEVNHAGDTRLSEEALSALEANLVEHGGKATVRRVDHPGHSRHDNSPLHPAVESGSLASVFGSGPPTEFTDDDRREMQAIRERTSSGAASGSAVERPTRLGRG